MAAPLGRTTPRCPSPWNRHRRLQMPPAAHPLIDVSFGFGPRGRSHPERTACFPDAEWAPPAYQPPHRRPQFPLLSWQTDYIDSYRILGFAPSRAMKALTKSHKTQSSDKRSDKQITRKRSNLRLCCCRPSPQPSSETSQSRRSSAKNDPMRQISAASRLDE